MATGSPRRGYPYAVFCVGRTPWTREYRKYISSHKKLDRACIRAEKGAHEDDPPTADAIAVIAAALAVSVIGTLRRHDGMPPEYEWIVVDERTGQRIYTCALD